MPRLTNMKRVLTAAISMAFVVVTSASAVESQEKNSETLAERHKRLSSNLDDGLQKRLQGDPAELRSYVVSVFYGIYYSYTVARVDYCSKQGVQLPKYLKAYKDANSTDLAAARKLTEDDKDYEARLHAAIGRQTAAAAERIMQQMADARYISPQALCTLFEQNAEYLGIRESFSVRSPQYSKVLRELAAKAQ